MDALFPFAIDFTDVIVDNYGSEDVRSDLTFTFGLDESNNYYLTNNSSLARPGFVVLSSVSSITDELDVAIAGRVLGVVEATLLVPPPLSGYAKIEFAISDLNNLIEQRSGAISVVYEVQLSLEVPSFLDILLMNPDTIVQAIEGLFDQVEAQTFGRRGVVAKLNVPIGGTGE